MMGKVDDLKDALAEVVDEYLDEIEDQIENQFWEELDEANEELSELARECDGWKELFCVLFDVPRCMIENVDDARRLARKTI